jgi:hypothetical protein
MGAAKARILTILAVAGSLAATSCSGSKKRDTPASAREVTIFVTTELKGQIEPCGCTSDPLGDLARTAQLINAARQGKPGVVHVDGGSLLFGSVEIPETLIGQEALRAGLLADTIKKIGVDAVGLGPYDFSRGVDAIAIPRAAANLGDDAKIPRQEPRVIDAGGVKVGVFGVVAPEAVSAWVEAGPAAPAAAAAIAKLEAGGAEVIVGLLHMPRAAAIRLAREVEGIDFAVIGQEAPADPARVSDEAIRAGDTWLVQPADRGQVITRLDLTVRGKGAFSDAIGAARAEVEKADLKETIGDLESRLEGWRAAPDADPAFVAAREKELAAARARLAKLEKSPLEIPASGPWFVLEQIRIAKGLPCASEVVAAKRAYDRAAGAANVKAAAGKKPEPAKPGEASYVGIEECSTCHGKAEKQWKGTVHAGAWETLEKLGKQNHLDCIYCHVTGFDKPGGSNLAFNESLRDIQCEVCHGPGGKHVEADGEGHIQLTPTRDLCVVCHNEEHSDTFDFEPYLRDVTGPGHGEKFRERLGDGPTGGELRRAALEKAGLEIGDGCSK